MQPVRVAQTAVDDVVGAGQDVRAVGTAPVLHARRGELLAVAHAAARVRQYDEVTGRGQGLQREQVAATGMHAVRTAVDLDVHRQPTLAGTRRAHEEVLDLAAVGDGHRRSLHRP